MAFPDMSTYSQPDEAGADDDSARLDDLEARVSAIEQKLVMGQDVQSPADASQVGGAMAGKKNSYFG